MADDYLSEVRGVFLQHVREMNDYGDREETDRVVADEAAEFDRMIAQVQAETLREFAHSIPGDVHDARDVADLARVVADHIEKEAGR